MRMVLLCVSALAIATAVPDPADARKRKALPQDRAEQHYSPRGQSWRRQDSSDAQDRLRAESCDPSGQYRAYPAWARAAFTCGRSR